MKDYETYGWELHSYDGSSEPVIVKNINENDGAGGDGISYHNVGIIQVFGQFQSTMNSFYLQVKIAISNVELWRTDGTEDGTYMVKDINKMVPVPAFFFPLDEERVLFSANSGSGHELWISDGTEVGTNAVGTAHGEGFVQWFTKHNDIVYFMGNAGDNSGKKALWRTDGTADGTYRLTNASGSQCTFNCIDLQSPGNPLGDIVIFKGHSVEYGEELYKYNPATNETSLVVDMEPGSDDSE